MKTIFRIANYLSIVIFIILLNCNNITAQTVYVRSAEVFAPIVPPPLHINCEQQAGGLTVSPKLWINSYNSIDAAALNSLADTTETPDSKNLFWSFPQVAAGMDFTYSFSSLFSFFGGLQYSYAHKNNLFGGNFGMGLFVKMKNISFRVDGGFIYQQYYYDAVTCINIKNDFLPASSSNLYYFHDADKIINLNPFLTFTISTLSEKGPLNYYFAGGYFTQNIFGFKPGGNDYPANTMPSIIKMKDLDTDYNAGFILLNPGISYNIDADSKLNFDLKLLKEVKLDQTSNTFFILPSIQLDINF